MFWREEKLAGRIKELASYRYRDPVAIQSFRFQMDHSQKIVPSPPIHDDGATIRIGDHWSGRDLYAWLQTSVDIPSEWQGRRVVGVFNFGKTGDGNNSGFESLLYINGTPYQGVDANHQEVFFPDGCAGSSFELSFRLWSGLEGGGLPAPQEHKLQQADVAWFDEATDDLYYTASAVLKTIHVLHVHAPEREQLLKALDRAFWQLDWSRPGTESFYQSVEAGLLVLQKELDTLKQQHPVTITAIGHTHIDVAWLWRLKHTREKAVRSFSTVLRLMEDFPEYTFLQTQPQLYEYVKTDFPELYDRIRERIKEGRWEAGGGMWLEADCNIPSGESLVRQLLMGTRFFREEFGTECNYLWLPDVFGYSWALPQILKKSGINTFMTTKISWNQYNRMPHDTFKWKGIDGTEIVTHFITTTDTDDDWSGIYTYNGHILPETVTGAWAEYKNKSLNQELLLAYGYGDGGGGVNREMLEMSRRLRDMPGLPNVKSGRADEYFQRLQMTVENTDQYVHTWDGELYFEYHRGTYTSQAAAKRMNRKLELLYREVEWIASVEGLLTSGVYPEKQLKEGWQIILRNQFHDIIPGTSIREVYEDSAEEYKQAEAIAHDILEKSMKSLLSHSRNRYAIWNSAGWERSGLVMVPMEAGLGKGVWVDADGRRLEACTSGENWLIYVKGIPATGIKSIEFSPSSAAETPVPFQLLPNGLSTPYYEIEWNEIGQLTRIYDRKEKRDCLQKGEKGNVLQVFEDKPMNFDAWDIDLYYQEKMREIDELKSIRVIEMNGLRAIVEFEWAYSDSNVKQRMIVYTNSRRIDFETTIDWHEKNQMLKTAFTVAVRSNEATYDIQFGNLKRPTHWNTSWDHARFEVVGHQWADLSERGYGVSLLNDCKYGYDIKDSCMRLTLLRSATNPDHLQDQGRHEFTYSLLPHKGDWVEENTVWEAWDLNQPLTYSQGNPVLERFSLFDLSADHVMIDAIKKAEDSEKTILRIHEFTGRRGPVQISCDLDIRSWQECDLMERPIGDSHQAEDFIFEILPYEIKTFIVDITHVQNDEGPILA